MESSLIAVVCPTLFANLFYLYIRSKRNGQRRYTISAMASALISCQSLSKAHGARPLFENLSFAIEDEERAALIGPNGAGKSTLMKLLAGLEKPDVGVVSARRGTRIAYVPQEEEFVGGATVEGVLRAALASDPMDETERSIRIEMMLAAMQFPDPAQTAHTLSGGWQKRLSLAQTAITEPDLILLDEPTNHLDLDGVLWLEEYLQNANFAYLVISHDRYFLENVAKRVIELNPAYAGGFFAASGAYSDFLEKRDAYFERQTKEQQSLAGVVRREVAWLRRGAKARTTKAKGRIEQAGELIADLGELKYRNAQAEREVAGIAFSASGRQTKEMVVLKGVGKSLGGRQILKNVELTISPKRRLGVVGPNGSGKTTLLRLIAGELEPDAGTVKRAADLKIVWFSQSRDELDKTLTLRDALSPNSDTVEYRGGTMHVSGWAKRFLFRQEQLPQSVSALSGGEQARVLIARLMLMPADVLILDEPTNDLDIPTLDILTESLLSFPGAVVLVTHDRMMLDQVTTEIAGLMGDGTVKLVADYEQYEEQRSVVSGRWSVVSKGTGNREQGAVQSPSQLTTDHRPLTTARLSASERKELAAMEETILAAEENVGKWEAALSDPATTSNPAKVAEAWDALQAARETVNELFARWEDLESRKT